jgi:tetratricopeptide (TPR) repeat protein
VRLNPHWADAHSNLGFILAQQGRLAEANEEFRAALVEAPRMWEPHYGLAASCAAQGKTAEAILFAGKACNIAQSTGDRGRVEKCEALLQALNAGTSPNRLPASSAPAAALSK